MTSSKQHCFKGAIQRHNYTENIPWWDKNILGGVANERLGGGGGKNILNNSENFRGDKIAVRGSASRVAGLVLSYKILAEPLLRPPEF